MKLVIVESPAKCKKIESYLGSGYKCVASFGHIRQLGDKKDGLKCIDITNNFKPTYKNLPEKTKNIKQLRDNIKNATEVILATDDDREGEAIAWHICKLFKLPVETTKRIIFHEITKTAIKKAVENPTVLDLNKVRAQQARQILDKLVGFTLSPVLYNNISKSIGYSTGLSAGRCQTPALRLVYEQELEIKKSPGKRVYDTEGDFTKKNITFKLNYNFEKEEKMVDFLEESVEWQHEYNVSDPKQVVKKPPLPFSTSILQQKASNELGYSPKQTMRVAQNLYEAGHITYMRTDNKVYSPEFIKTIKKFIQNRWDKTYVSKNLSKVTLGGKKKKKKDDTAQEAHEAIRPTNIENNILEIHGKITNKEKRLYELIWKNTMKSCMSDAIFDSITAFISAPYEKKYKCNEEKCVFSGWKIIDNITIHDDFKIYEYLLKKKKKSIVKYNEIRSRVVLKNLKKHYTEATLVSKLEKMGIGRPSTFSSLISKIQDRTYVKKEDVEGKKLNCTDFVLKADNLDEYENTRTIGNEKNKLVLQPLGLIVIEFLLKWFDNMFIYDYTKNMEEDLDHIAEGKKVWYSLCETCHEDMSKLINVIPKPKKGEKRSNGIKIDEYHTYMIGKYGPCLKYEKDGETLFKKAKKSLDMDKLRNGEYKLDEIIEKYQSNQKVLGEYKGEKIIMKTGKFGPYITHNGKNYSMKGAEGTLEDAIRTISQPKTSGILKEFDLENDISCSIRTGKYGPYLFYKKKGMKRPKFINLGKQNWKELTKREVINLLSK
tara:strand:+ start:3061 stop:5373 length:2313 start_codon:yes stop_codon:yes gene_type:complete